MTEFSIKIKEIISSIPQGKVMSYGQIALLAGSPMAARQVARFLHSSSKKYNLPWHRVLGAKGRISLPRGGGFEEQEALLLSEGVGFEKEGWVDWYNYQWQPEKS